MRIAPRMTAHNLVIREAGTADAEALQRLYAHLVPDPGCIRVDPERISDIAEDTNNLLLVAEFDGRVVGTALLTFCLDPMFGRQPFAVVENVVVEPAYQTQGCGRALFEAIDHVALDADCSKIMLLSGEARAGAHRFFVSMGFLKGEKSGFVKYRRNFAR